MKIVLSLGRLHPLKGLDLLIAAWAEVVRSSKVLKCESAKVAEECTDTGMHEENFRTLELQNFRISSWQLVIAGPDEQGTQEKLKALSEKLKLKVAELRDLSGVCDADILFMGPVHGDEKWALMQRADIFVLPSRSENFGMVVGEALSCGVPVVTTAVGPWGEGGEVLKCESSRVLKCESSKVLKLGEGEVRECANAGMRELEVLKFEPASLGATPSQGSAKVSREDERSLARADWLRGLIVVDTSAEGLAEGLRRMMALSDTERKELGSKGCAWVKSEFSWESVAKQMLEAYNTAHIKA